jgi:hypothetical protein
MILDVEVNNEIRKVEWLSQDEEDYHIALGKILKVFDIEGTIQAIARDSDDIYSIYFSEGLEVSPVDLSGLKTDPLTQHLISMKLNLIDKSIRVKTYHIGNIKNIEFDKPITGTGLYEGSEAVTVYYPTNGIVPDVEDDVMMPTAVREGYSATTFYPDGTNSEESVYKLRE